jgi:imidazole glycerol phosphate synthase subunit HisF
VEDKGAGEIIVQSIENDGKMNGYDLDLTPKEYQKMYRYRSLLWEEQEI